MRTLIIVLCSLVLTGCAKPLEVTSITEINGLTGGRGVDVHEVRRASGEPGVPQFAGDQLLEVRTYAIRPGSGEVEIAGADCSLSAADFNATMTTPAKVRVPLYRNQSSTLAVTCQMPGYQQKMITVGAIDVTRQQRMASGAGAGIIGVLTTVAVDSFADNSQNTWQYPLARLVLEPAAKQSTASTQ
jgi:hypothetical protein